MSYQNEPPQTYAISDIDAVVLTYCVTEDEILTSPSPHPWSKDRFLQFYRAAKGILQSTLYASDNNKKVDARMTLTEMSKIVRKHAKEHKEREEREERERKAAEEEILRLVADVDAACAVAEAEEERIVRESLEESEGSAPAQMPAVEEEDLYGSSRPISPVGRCTPAQREEAPAPDPFDTSKEQRKCSIAILSPTPRYPGAKLIIRNKTRLWTESAELEEHDRVLEAGLRLVNPDPWQEVERSQEVEEKEDMQTKPEYTDWAEDDQPLSSPMREYCQPRCGLVLPTVEEEEETAANAASMPRKGG